MASVLLSIALASGSIFGTGSAALAGTVFFLLATWCFTHNRVDHTLIALALYLGLLDGYIKLRTGSSTVTLARDALVVTIAAGALVRVSQTKQALYLPPLGGFVAAFIAVVLTELANPSSRGLTVGLAGVRQHLEFVPLFFLGYAFIRSKSQIRKALFVIVLCAAVGGVVSYVQSTLTPAQLAQWGPGYQERVIGTGLFAGSGRVGFDSAGAAVVRPFGLGSDVGAGAAAAALALPALVALLMMATPWVRLLLAPMAVGIGLAIATSGSRAALITVFVALLAFGLISAVSKNALKAIVGIAVSIAVIYGAFVQLGPNNASTQRAKSVAPTKALSTFTSERGSSVAAFKGLATAYPLGVGLGTVGPAGGFNRTAEQAQLNAETQWNFLVIELGLAGVLIYVCFLLRLSWLAVSRIRHFVDPELRIYLGALAAPICALLVAGFSGPSSVTVPLAPYLWLVSGVLAYFLVTAYRRRDAPRIGEPPGARGLAPLTHADGETLIAPP